MKRITMITGHYGSGKTEVSVNLACDLKKEYVIPSASEQNPVPFLFDNRDFRIMDAIT